MGEVVAPTAPRPEWVRALLGRSTPGLGCTQPPATPTKEKFPELEPGKKQQVRLGTAGGVRSRALV